jgi:hypothetical protein
MKRACLMYGIVQCSLLSIMALPVSATEAPTAKCEPISKMEADAKGAKFTKLNAGQYHVMMGIYLGSPITPEGLPPGDGALLVQSKAASLVFWTKGDKEACIVQLKLEGQDHQPHLMYSPMILPPAIVMVLKDIVGGKDEIATPANDPKDELKL